MKQYYKEIKKTKKHALWWKCDSPIGFNYNIVIVLDKWLY